MNEIPKHPTGGDSGSPRQPRRISPAQPSKKAVPGTGATSTSSTGSPSPKTPQATRQPQTQSAGSGSTPPPGMSNHQPPEGESVTDSETPGMRGLISRVRGRLEEFIRYNFSPDSLGPVSRREAASFTVASLAVGYVTAPVAFYYGATGQIFFQNLMLIWVGSVIALMVRGIVGTTTDGKRHFTWTSTCILALPSVWLCALLLDLQGTLLSFVDLGMGLVSLPYILWVMFRAAVPEAVRVRSRRLVVGFVLILAVVVSCAFGLGQNHHRFLNCEDFTISGAYAPSNCVKSDRKDALP